jgi:hypothetical protein
MGRHLPGLCILSASWNSDTEAVTRMRLKPLSKFRTFVSFVTFCSNYLSSLLFTCSHPRLLNS